MGGRRSVFMALIAGAGAGFHSAVTPMAWLDSAHVAFRYARRVSDDGSVRLLGQAGPVEGFTDPLWTGVLSALGMLGVHEANLQPYLGPVLCALLVGLSVLWVSRARSDLSAAVFVGLLAASPVLAVSGRSGTDDLFLAVLVLCSAWGCSRASRWAVVPLVALALSGVLPLVVALGLAVGHSRRALGWVAASVIAMTGVRLAVFGTIWPHAGMRMLQGFEPSVLFAAGQFVPVGMCLGLAGVVVLWRRGGDLVWPLAWPIGAGIVGAGLLWPQEHDFAAAMVPVIPLLGVAAALGLSRLPRGTMTLSAAGLAILAMDARIAFDEQEAVVGARQSERAKARAMAKFLRWRFAEGATVVVQTPGMLPYFLRMPTVDLQGLTHTGPTDQAAMQALDPEVMIPQGAIVSNTAMRLSMSDDWDWKSLGTTHVQHAIMQSKDWEVVPVHPTWFNFYMRESLPKYPPKWVEIYAREEAERAAAKKRAEDKASAR
jgi:hypothetical protein